MSNTWLTTEHQKQQKKLVKISWNHKTIKVTQEKQTK